MPPKSNRAKSKRTASPKQIFTDPVSFHTRSSAKYASPDQVETNRISKTVSEHLSDTRSEDLEEKALETNSGDETVSFAQVAKAELEAEESSSSLSSLTSQGSGNKKVKRRKPTEKRPSDMQIICPGGEKTDSSLLEILATSRRALQRNSRNSEHLFAKAKIAFMSYMDRIHQGKDKEHQRPEERRWPQSSLRETQRREWIEARVANMGQEQRLRWGFENY